MSEEANRARAAVRILAVFDEALGAPVTTKILSALKDEDWRRASLVAKCHAPASAETMARVFEFAHARESVRGAA